MEEETAKPEKEKDYDLIAECAEMTAELKGIKTDFSDEELHVMAEQVRYRAEAHQKRRRKIGRLLLAACITMLILSVSVLSFGPENDFLKIFLRFSKKVVGETIVEGNFEYVYNGKENAYHSIEEFARNENVQVLYPAALPEKLKMEKIVKLQTSESFKYVFVFNDLDYNIYMDPCEEMSEEILSNSDSLSIDGRTFYICEYSVNEFYAYIQYQHFLFTFVSDNYDSLIDMLSNLQEVS